MPPHRPSSSLMGIIDKTLGWVEKTANTWRHQRAARNAYAQVQSRQANRHPSKVGESFFSRVLSSLTGGWGWPGMWARDRLEFPQHFRHWNFVAVNCIGRNIRSRVPTIAWVEPEDHHQEGIQHKVYRQWRYEKTMGSVHPHEKITPIPPNHPIKRLIDHPNAWDTAGLSDILYQTIMYLKLAGEAYWWLIPDQNTGLPCEWWVIPTHWVWPRMGQNGIFQVDVRPFPGGGSGTIYIPWDQIVYFQYPSPLSKIGGWSTQRAISEWIDVDDSINQSRFWTFKNVLAPMGAIELGENFQDPSDEELERIYIKFFIRFQGEFNHGKPIILPPGAKFSKLEIMPSECAFEGSAEQLMKWTLAAYNVPMQIAGLSDAGSEVAMWGPICQFHEQAIKPDLVYMGQVATNQMCHRWDERLRWWWDNPTDSSPEQRRADRGQQLQYGLVTTNEARAEDGLPPFTDEEEAKYSKLLQKQGGGAFGGMPGALPGPGGPGGGPGGPSSPVLRRYEELYTGPGYVGSPGAQPSIMPAHAFPVDHHQHNGRKSWSNGVTLPSNYKPNEEDGDSARLDRQNPVKVSLVERARLKALQKKRYGCIMIPIDGQLREKLAELASAVPDEDLHQKGREEDFHVTLLYGLSDDSPESVRACLEKIRPFNVTLGCVEMFPDTGDGEVLMVKVEGDDLHALHHYLRDKLPHIDTQSSYCPHVTLAYLGTGKAQQHLGESGLESEEVTVEKVVYSTPEKVRHMVALGGKESGSVQGTAPVAVTMPAMIEERMNGAIPVPTRDRVSGKKHKRPMRYEELMAVGGNGNGHGGNGSFGLVEKGEHQEGDKWKGPSGGWFTLEDGHVHPTSAQAQTTAGESDKKPTESPTNVDSAVNQSTAEKPASFSIPAGSRDVTWFNGERLEIFDVGVNGEKQPVRVNIDQGKWANPETGERVTVYAARGNSSRRGEVLLRGDWKLTEAEARKEGEEWIADAKARGNIEMPSATSPTKKPTARKKPAAKKPQAASTSLDKPSEASAPDGGTNAASADSEPGKVSFTPAKTTKEASVFAAKHLAKDGADYSGIDVEVANEINSSISKRMNDWPFLKEVGIDEIKSFTRKSAVMGVVTNIETGGKVIGIMKHMKDKAAWDRLYDLSAKMMAEGKPPWGAWGHLPREQAIQMVVDHELCHLIREKAFGDNERAEWHAAYASDKEALHKISYVASVKAQGHESWTGEEALCESLALILNGKADMVPEKSRAVIRKLYRIPEA